MRIYFYCFINHIRNKNPQSKPSWLVFQWTAGILWIVSNNKFLLYVRMVDESFTMERKRFSNSFRQISNCYLYKSNEIYITERCMVTTWKFSLFPSNLKLLRFSLSRYNCRALQPHEVLNACLVHFLSEFITPSGIFERWHQLDVTPNTQKLPLNTLKTANENPNVSYLPSARFKVAGEKCRSSISFPFLSSLPALLAPTSAVHESVRPEFSM